MNNISNISKENIIEGVLAEFAKLAEILEIPSEQVLAIGDSSNDVSMLTSVAISVAMGNANDEARAAARYMVTDNEHDGVAEALERFCM